MKWSASSRREMSMWRKVAVSIQICQVEFTAAKPATSALLLAHEMASLMIIRWISEVSPENKREPVRRGGSMCWEVSAIVKVLDD